MPPYTVILNPTAGHGNGLRARPLLQAALARQEIRYDLLCTEHPGHATLLARQAAQDGAGVLVAAGGDGTLNEVVNGLMQSALPPQSRPLVGVLCVGRGNDFAASAGIPQDLPQACQLLKDAPRHRIDIGRVSGGLHPQGRYFVNCVGVGFDAVGTIQAAKLPRWGGFASFLLAILKTIFLYSRAPLATIAYDGQSLTQRSLMISMMNGRRLGGGFLMAPHAQLDDGLLDLCIAEQMSPLRILRLIPHFMRGTQSTQKTIRTGRASTIHITALDGPLPAQTDGEIISTDGRHLTVEVLPRQIDMICRLPEKAP